MAIRSSPNGCTLTRCRQIGRRANGGIEGPVLPTHNPPQSSRQCPWRRLARQWSRSCLVGRQSTGQPHRRSRTEREPRNAAFLFGWFRKTRVDSNWTIDSRPGSPFPPGSSAYSRVTRNLLIRCRGILRQRRGDPAGRAAVNQEFANRLRVNARSHRPRRCGKTSRPRAADSCAPRAPRRAPGTPFGNIATRDTLDRAAPPTVPPAAP